VVAYSWRVGIVIFGCCSETQLGLIWIGRYRRGFRSNPCHKWTYTRAWAEIPFRKYVFGKRVYQAGPLPIHADRRGNPATPSDVGKLSCSRSLLMATMCSSWWTVAMKLLLPAVLLLPPPPRPRVWLMNPFLFMIDLRWATSCSFSRMNDNIDTSLGNGATLPPPFF
jgi:hypothetical protein